MDRIPAIAEDLRDSLRAFIDYEVRFLVVGGYALAVHGHPRATGDLDVLPVIGREALLANKRALGRHDRADVELLEGSSDD